MMVDTVWTLSHNNGPIFNKGQFYCHYNAALLVRILDVQRSGQVPEAILYDPAIKSFLVPELTDIMKAAHAEFAGKIGPCLDWLRVEALGSKMKYPADIALQHKAGNVTPEQQAALAKAIKDKQIAEAAAAQAAAQAKAEHAKKWFMVMPGVEVEKVQRAA
jgi:hypothetical protein